jgi:hypothetical protein
MKFCGHNPLAFADPEIRSQWIHEKGMRVLSLWDPANPMREVDLFVEHPIEFNELWNRSEVIELARTLVRIASIPDLIYLKRLAGRPEDLADIEPWKLFCGEREAAMPDDERPETPSDDWEAGWETHRRHQLALALKATPAQRLAWLEEMITLAYRVGALPKSRG